MGDAFHLNRKNFDKAGVHYFSSNYALFGDISDRVMRTIASEVPALEIYSIDEAFVDLTGIPNLDAFSRKLQEMIWKRHGMPVGIGISVSKTLAKVANWRAKNSSRSGGVLDLVTADRRELLLRHTPVDEVWGVGRKLSEKLKADLQVETAWQLAEANRSQLQDRYGVVMVRTSRELAGEDCFGLELDAEPSKMIGSSKMFGVRVSQLALLKQALTAYTTRCAEKLRAQGSQCSVMSVSLNTSPHDEGPQHHGSIKVQIAVPTDDTRLLVEAACRGLDQIFVPDRAYCRTGVVFTHLIEKADTPADLFACPETDARSARAMGVLDEINQRFGRNTLHTGRLVSEPIWAMRANYMTPRYTTRLSDLPIVR